MVKDFSETLIAQINIGDEMLKTITDDLLNVYYELGENFSYQCVSTKVASYGLSLEQTHQYIVLMYTYGLFAEKIDAWGDKPQGLSELLYICNNLNCTRN